MIVRNIEDVSKTSNDVFWGNGSSTRLLTRSDNVGFTVAHTKVNANTKSLLEYKNHVEACYCIAGEGKVVVPSLGKEYDIKPGTIYTLDNNEEHYLITSEAQLELVTVFTPALKGDEVHALKPGVSSSY